MISLLLITACAGRGNMQTEDPLSRVTAPAPTVEFEENEVLRKPEYLGDPEEYSAATDPVSPPDTPNTQEPPSEDEEKRISFVAVGDNIIHSAIMEDAARHAADGEEYNFNYIYDNVRDVIKGADVAFVNQETLFGGKQLGYYGFPNFNGPQEAGDALVKTGFDIVCIANNHMCDMRDAGFIGTVEYWREQPVTLIGGYLNQDDYENIRVHEKNGIKIALLAYTYDPYTTNGMKFTASSGLVTPIYNEDVIRRHVAAAKKLGDIVIVNMHWGTDSSFTVTADQKKYAQLLADCGVDVIIGEHPHVLQPMQWITGENGGKTLLTYSIGNFLSTQYNDYFMVGGMLSFDIVKDSDGTRIEKPLLIPTVTYYDVNRSNLSIYFLEKFTAELCSSHGCNAHGATSLEKMRKYVTNAIPNEFLPDTFQ